jgi:hypothetical protein
MVIVGVVDGAVVAFVGGGVGMVTLVGFMVGAIVTFTVALVGFTDGASVVKLPKAGEGESAGSGVSPGGRSTVDGSGVAMGVGAGVESSCPWTIVRRLVHCKTRNKTANVVLLHGRLLGRRIEHLETSADDPEMDEDIDEDALSSTLGRRCCCGCCSCGDSRSG